MNHRRNMGPRHQRDFGGDHQGRDSYYGQGSYGRHQQQFNDYNDAYNHQDPSMNQGRRSQSHSHSQSQSYSQPQRGYNTMGEEYGRNNHGGYEGGRRGGYNSYTDEDYGSNARQPSSERYDRSERELGWGGRGQFNQDQARYSSAYYNEDEFSQGGRRNSQDFNQSYGRRQGQDMDREWQGYGQSRGQGQRGWDYERESQRNMAPRRSGSFRNNNNYNEDQYDREYNDESRDHRGGRY